MAQSKKKIILVCENCLDRNYSLSKSTLIQRQRFQIKKYCKRCNAHTLHKETR